MSRVIGIDLGTTRSLAAAVQGSEPQIIPTAEGDRFCPSIVAFTHRGETLVGEPARRQAIVNPQNTIFAVKRLLGRDYADVAAEESCSGCRLVAGLGGAACVAVPATNRICRTPEIGAWILRKLKHDAELFLGEPVQQVVITVPAHFDDRQRQATREAGRIAGLEVLRIINEPTAAALAYGLRRSDNARILVWDLGGGSFDVSILEIGNGVIQVKASAGDSRLGGHDWDERIAGRIVARFALEYGIDLNYDPQTRLRLHEVAEQARIALSEQTETTIDVPFITSDGRGPRHLQMQLSRQSLEEMTEDLRRRCSAIFEQALNDAGILAEQLDEVILVGAASRMPAIRELVHHLTGGKVMHAGIDPDEVVAMGAALQAGILAGEVSGVVLLDVTPLSLGVETQGGVMTTLIERNTTIPTRKSAAFSTVVDQQAAVDIHVLQGERELAADNISLGHFRLCDIPVAPRGRAQIEVTFNLDADGILAVTAREKTSGKEQQIRLVNAGKTEQSRIDWMMAEAEQHSGDDYHWRELITARNQADQLIYDVEQYLVTHELPLVERCRIDDQIRALREATLGDEPARIRQQRMLLDEMTAELRNQAPA